MPARKRPLAVLLAAAALLLVAPGHAAAQSPQPAPGQKPNDATPGKKDAKSNLSTPPAQTSPTPAPASAAPSAKPSAPLAKSPSATAVTVWGNTDSRVYHLPGSRWYGKTKHGKYMTEADAIKAGYRPASKNH